MCGSLKAAEIKGVLDGASIKCFVETGIHNGDTTLTAAPMFEAVHAFEIHKPFIDNVSDRAKKAGLNNIMFHHGDTEKIFAGILRNEVLESAIFYLDAHKSWENGKHVGGWSNIDVPLLFEIQAISGRNYDDIIIIDDRQFFENKFFEVHNEPIMADWSKINEETILSYFDKRRIKNSYVSNDRFIIKLQAL